MKPNPNAKRPKVVMSGSPQVDSHLPDLREERRQHALTKRQLRHERYARNITGAVALVGWVIALAVIGGAL